MTEKQPYRVVSRMQGFELREYPAYTTIAVDVQESFNDSVNRGFGPLVSYIGGANADGAKIAMTTPVIQEPTTTGTHSVQFVMPAGMSVETMPAPADARVARQEVAAHLGAAIRYTGLATESAFRKHLAKLTSAIAAAGYEPAGPARSARFDPPWIPPFARRNEVIVPVVPVSIA